MPEESSLSERKQRFNSHALIQFYPAGKIYPPIERYNLQEKQIKIFWLSTFAKSL
jgi:hypothetical protein